MKSSAKVIADSIINLSRKSLITIDGAQNITSLSDSIDNL